MGKTYKKFPWGQYRKPRGRKHALIQGARKKAIPPNSWEDIRADDQCWLPYKLARRFYDNRMSYNNSLDK